MKKINLIVVGLIIIVLLSVGVLSQLALSPVTNVLVKDTLVTASASLEEKETCVTEFYEETEDIYGSCIYYDNGTSCLNVTGKNTDCSVSQTTWNFRCKTGEEVLNKNKTTCRPNEKFEITINDEKTTLRKQIDYSDFGPCIYEEVDNCLVVTCQSKYDGANDGVFHGCKSGTSCQKFEICNGEVKTYYKNSRNDFVEEDPTFVVPKLVAKEVEE